MPPSRQYRGRVRWADVTISAVLVGLCAFAIAQHGHGPAPKPAVIPPVAVGEPLDTHLTLTDVAGEPRVLADMLGKTATVLYSWKIECPCIEICEPRLREVHAAYGKGQGVVWIAVDGEPSDERKAVLAKMVEIGSFQKMLLDPDQRLSAKVGFDRAAQVAVLDADGRLRYRGSIDDDYKKPTRSYVREALAAVSEGREPALAETKPVYGCAYSQEPVCTE
jgi:hypothetical protein